MMKVWKRVMALIMVCALCITPLQANAAGSNRQNVIVDGGMSHTVLLTSDGTVKVCGSNQEMQLGIPDEQEVKTFQKVDGLDGIISVAAGYNFSAALKFDGTVYTWGGSVQKTPTQVKGLSSVVAIAAGQTHLLALTYSGQVYQWSLGKSPAKVPGLSNIVAVDAGAGHYMALTSNGDVYTWGSNWSGQLGTENTTDSSTPRKLNLFNVVDIAAGYSHSLAVTHEGTVYAWGSNNYGQLGDGTTETALTPVQVKNLKNAVQVTAGTDCSMALTQDDKLYSWGYGEYGQLGNGSATISQNTPKTISSVSGAAPAQINCGVYHCMYLTEKGNLYSWGRNKNYQLGSSKNLNAESPQRINTSAGSISLYHTDMLSTASSWAKSQLEVLYDQNMVSPLMWKSYQGNLTRAEFAHLLVSLYRTIRGSNPSATTNQKKFTDIQTHLLRDDIIRAYNLKLINGTSDSTFSPDSPLTRQEAAKMLCSLLSVIEGVKVPTSVTSMSYYQDASQIASWAAPYVAYSYRNNIMTGTTSNTFSPKSNLTREQGLLIVARLVDKYDWA